MHTDHSGSNAAQPRLRQLTSQYVLNDIFNVDEFGLFYTAAPTKTMGPAALLVEKKAKQRVILFVCTNVDWTERVQSLMIGEATRPRCFGRISGAELGLDYESGPKALMSSDIFFH